MIPNMSRVFEAILSYGLGLLVVALVFSVQLSWDVEFAAAGHGSYTAHSHAVTEFGSSDYRINSTTSTSSAVDWMGVSNRVTRNGQLIINDTIICGQVNEGCISLQTPTKFWEQSGSASVVSEHAAFDTDGNHTLCTPINNLCHVHSSGPYQ